MRFDATVSLHRLHCITPTDPSGTDEPYAWVFFVKLDGSTIRQRHDAAGHPMNRFSATISVHSGTGGHRNLASSSVVSGSTILVPSAVGRHETTLKPITIDLEGATETVRVFVPGSLLVLALLMDEDSAPDEAPPAALEAVKEHIGHRLNDLLNEMDLAGFILAALGAMSQGQDPAPVVLAGVLAQLAQLQQTIRKEAVDLAIERAKAAALEAADRWNPLDGFKLVVAALDPDEVIGSATFMLTEQSLAGVSLAQLLQSDLRQSSTGLGGAWYSLSGGAGGSVKFTLEDFSVYPEGKPVRKVVEQASHIIRTGRRCLDTGAEFAAIQLEFAETHVVTVDYPFLSYRYFLDDVELVGDPNSSNAPDSIELQNKTVSFPEFDESKFYLIAERQETRNVRLSFERRPARLRPQIVQLVLRNDPKDGNYRVTLRIEAILPDGQAIPVGTTDIAIHGQAVELADGFLEHYIQCVAGYLKSLSVRMKPTVPAQWRTPEIKWQQHDLVARKLDELVELQVLDLATVSQAKIALARKLGIG